MIFDVVWTQTHQPATNPYQYIEVADVDRVCRQMGAVHAGRIYGCATLYGKDCIIYLPKSAPDWLIKHEEKHCEGYTHD